MDDELDGGVFVVVVVVTDELDGAVFETETDVVVVLFPPSVNDSIVLAVSLKSLLLLPSGTAVIGAAVAKLPGHFSTYVVSAPSKEALPPLVGNSSETPPCWSVTTRIVTVTTSTFILLVFLLIEAGEEEEGGTEAKISAVPAAVILGTVEVDADALVELT